jgi:hypothetical protein
MSDIEQGGGSPPSNTPKGEVPDKRQRILQQIEAGEISVDDGLKMLENLQPTGSDDVLDQLESGKIDVEEAIQRIVPTQGSKNQGDSVESSPEIIQSERMPDWRSWWYLLLGFGLAGIAAGGWLGTVGGWWWVCAIPTLFLGALFFVLALASFRSPWLHVRIDTGQETWPKRISFGLPVPFRFISWVLRRWGSRMSGLDNTALDELLLSLEGNLSSANPLVIDVHEDGDRGERIRVFLG